MPAVVSGFTVTERLYGSAISYGSDRCPRSIMIEYPPNCEQA
jgi:hypothetical protein